MSGYVRGTEGYVAPISGKAIAAEREGFGAHAPGGLLWHLLGKLTENVEVYERYLVEVVENPASIPGYGVPAWEQFAPIVKLPDWYVPDGERSNG